MLPKPNFNANPTNPVLSGTPSQPSGQTWFQFDPNRPLNHYPANNYQNNYYNPYANSYPTSQPVYWPQNSPNGNVWPAFHNQMNAGFNNYNRNNGQHYQRNDNRNHGFKGNHNKKPDTNGQTFGGHKSFNCDVCCRWFSTQEQYDQHISEHIMCGLDECTFKAHPKVIESHQRMQHFCFRDRTLVKKFMSLDTEEDIEKWKEERRKNFPTKDNVRRKQEIKKSEQSSHKRDHFSSGGDNQLKRKFDTKQETTEPTDDGDTKDVSPEKVAKEVETKQENVITGNKSNKKNRQRKGGKPMNRSMASNGRNKPNNRKQTLFQKLMAMDMNTDEEKKE